MFKFDFAISYAGEEEGIANDLFQLLLQKGATVFFAKSEKAMLFGKSLTTALPHIFGPYSKFVVPIVSKNYVQKPWTKYEFNIARKEEGRRSFEFILPLRVDDDRLEGLEEDILYIDIRKEGLLGTVDIMMQKLRGNYLIEEETVPNDWVATFGVVIDDLIQNQELPSSAPTGYAQLCDWLEEDLLRRLSYSTLQGLKQIEDSRNGETLSVRIGFKWDPDKAPLDFGSLDWWEILEITDFDSVYGS